MTTDFNAILNGLITNFVAEVTALAKAAATETMNNALGTTGELRKAPTRAKASSSGRSKGEKRAPEELEKIQASVFQYIKANPGTRIEPMGKALELKTADMALPVKKLIAAGQVRTEGERRSTKYYPAEAPAKKKKVATKKKAKKKAAPKAE